MSISSTLASIVAKVKLELPTLRECNAHDGQFSEDDLNRYIATDPSVYVSCLGWNDSEDQDEDLVVTAQWMMIVVTRRRSNEGSGATRLSAATGFAEQLAFLIRNNGTAANSWADEVNGPATKIKARNLNSDRTEKKGVTLWAIAWEQGVSVGQFDSDELDDFLTATTTYELTDSTGELTSESEFTTTVQVPTP